LPTQQNLKPKK